MKSPGVSTPGDRGFAEYDSFITISKNRGILSAEL